MLMKKGILEDMEWHIYHYHYHVSDVKTEKDEKRYMKFYNHCLDMYIKGVSWPPSLIAVYGTDAIKREDERSLGYAVTDCIQDIRMAARITHPRHEDFILSTSINRSVEAQRIWKEESEENGWPEVLEQLRMEEE